MNRRLRGSVAAAACAVLLIAVAPCPGRELEFSLDVGKDGDAIPAAILKVAEDAYDANLKGLDLLDKGMFDQAIGQFQTALSLLSNYADAENNIGVAYFRKGVVPEARRIWRGIAGKDPRYALAWHNLGVIAFHEKKFEEARDGFEKALGINKNLFETRVMLGRSLLSLGRKTAAVEQFGLAYKGNPKDPNAWNHLSWGLLQAGDTAGAQKVLGEHPGDVDALRTLGTISALRHNAAQAAEYFARAVEKGGSKELLVDLASTQIDARQSGAALVTLKRYFSLAGSGAVADAWLYAGIAAKETGDVKGARQYFEKGVEAFPKDHLLRYNLGQICFFQRDYAGAQRVLTPLSDSLQDPALFYIQALDAFRNGNFDGAESQIRRAIKLDERGDFYDLLGTVLYRKGDKEQAAVCYRKALNIDPGLRSAQLNLALINRGGEDLAKAIAEGVTLAAGCKDTCLEPALQLSILYYYARQFDKGVAVLARIPEPRRDERVYRHLALYHRELHEWDKSIAALEKLKSRFVTDQQTENLLAETFLLAGYHTRAVDAFTVLIPKWEGNPWRVYYQLGYAYMELGDLVKARESLEKSIQRKADNSASRALLAFIHNRMGNTGVARDLWQKTLKEDPGNMALLVNMGLSYERDGNYVTALDYYRKATAADPQNSGLQINIGNAYTGLGQYTDALNAYSLALRSEKRSLAVYNMFITAQKARNQAKAQDALAILEREFGSTPHALRAKGEMALWQGDTVKGIGFLEALPDKDDADWIALTRVYTARHNTARAEQCLARVSADSALRAVRTDCSAQIAYMKGDCRTALELWGQVRDTSFAFQYNIAMAALSCKKFEQAVAIGERLVSRATGADRADICRVTGNAWFGLKQWDNARKWYLQLSDVQANDPIVQYNLAVAYYNLADIKTAWTYYQKARVLDPRLSNQDIEKRYAASDRQEGATVAVTDSIDLWYNNAVDLQQKDSLGAVAAESLYNRILARDASYNRAWNNLGALYAGRGELEKAEVCYQKAVAKQHDMPETYANLVNVYIAMGDFVQAKRWIIKGLGHNPDSEVLKGLEQAVADSLTQRKGKK